MNISKTLRHVLQHGKADPHTPRRVHTLSSPRSNTEAPGVWHE
jgi:hypothetical protein